jgi:hypothetical protein
MLLLQPGKALCTDRTGDKSMLDSDQDSSGLATGRWAGQPLDRWAGQPLDRWARQPLDRWAACLIHFLLLIKKLVEG